MADIQLPAVEYDCHFLIQAPLDKGIHYLNDDVTAKKRILGNFELYWYGPRLDACSNIPENAVYVCAMEPYTDNPIHQQWPQGRKTVLLPFAPYYEPGSNNFKSKGILLTIKSPAVSELSDECIRQKLDHFHVALAELKKGTKVTVGYSNRLYVGVKDKFRDELDKLVMDLTDYGASFVGNVPPHRMRELIREHSIVLTGKVEGTNFYGSFMDALCYGSYPVIWADWPEQFFRAATMGAYSRQMLEAAVHNLQDYWVYNAALKYARENINLYTEAQGLEIIRKLINEK